MSKEAKKGWGWKTKVACSSPQTCNRKLKRSKNKPPSYQLFMFYIINLFLRALKFCFLSISLVPNKHDNIFLQETFCKSSSSATRLLSRMSVRSKISSSQVKIFYISLAGGSTPTLQTFRIFGHILRRSIAKLAAFNISSLLSFQLDWNGYLLWKSKFSPVLL